jgi:DNA primase
VSFDNDTAGSDAAERAIDLAEANDFSVKVATFGSLGKNAAGEFFKDAADAALADPANIKKVLENAVPAPEFYFAKYLKPSENLATREGLRSLRAILAKLKNIASPVERDFWLKELSKRTGVKEKTLQEETEKATGAQFAPMASRAGAGGIGANDEEISKKRQLSRQELIAEKLISAALAQNDFAALDDCKEFFNPTQKEILRILAANKRASEDPSLDEAIDIIVLRASEELAPAETAALKSELAKEYYKERRRILALAIKNAEARGNETELAAALEELKSLPVVTIFENMS